MRLEQLEYLAAVTRHGSLRRASEALHVSQPALSEAITKLERELRVTLLDRRRSGARISREGRDLLPAMVEVLGAVERLRVAAGTQRDETRRVRVGTVHAATSTLLTPVLRELRDTAPTLSVEVLALQQTAIDEGLAEGTLDLGLVNVLDGDDPGEDLVGTHLVAGRPVVVLPAGHRLADHKEIDVEDLRAEPYVMMRVGYLMHRFAHRLFGSRLPPVMHATDGAEMGKMLVAEGLGLTLLPDYSVDGDPLQRAGLLTSRPIAGDRTRVSLCLRHRRTIQPSRAAGQLSALLLARAEAMACATASTAAS